MTIWDNLMDKSYDKWRECRGWSYGEFLSNLDALERKAVVLGNFNHQVLNGGFQQWVDNGYASGSGMELLTVLSDMGTPSSRILRGIVVSVLVHVDLGIEKDGCFTNYWLDDPGEEELDRLTNRYYDLSDDFVADVDNYLRGSVSV